MWILLIASTMLSMNIQQTSTLTIGGVYTSQDMCMNAKSSYGQNQAFCVKAN